jgi:type VI secretion system secreted protein VgrG
MAEESRIFDFHTEAVPENTFQLAGMKGEERLSEPYQFELDLVSKKADVNMEKVLKEKAWLHIRQSIPVSGGKRGTRIYKIHGIVSEFEVLEKVQDWIKYRAVLVPRLWKCTLTTQSRVFQDVDIKDLIKKVLTDPDGPGLSTSDFEIKANGPFTKREFVVQYNETDLEFLHRWLEYEGVFYYIDQTESGEKIIFADGTAHYASLPGDPKIPYRPDPASRTRAAGATAEESLQEESVHSFHGHLKKTPKGIVLKDYNYRTPSVEVKGKADVENPAGDGRVYVYGEHFKTPKEGADLAKIRAEEIMCRDKTFDGTGDHRSFRPGTKFTLSEHYRADFNAAYLITNLRHEMTQGTAGGGITGGSMNHKIIFGCIPAADVFRPARITPWPSIHGFVNATIDAGGDGKYAEIDDQGRYKVKLPFDLSDKKDGKASRFLRMAQPYAGAQMGMHFPLHKGTEVLLAFIDGDPDRPIIASAIPNAETGGPVAASNQTQCAIHTGGGTKMVIEDTDGSQRFHVSTLTKSSYIQIGSKSDGGGGSTGTSGGQTGAPAAGSTDGAHIGTAGDFNIDNTGDHVHRTGGNSTVETTGNETTITQGNTEWETHGDSKTLTKGNTESVTIGNSKSKVQGNSESEIIGDSKSSTIGDSTSFVKGNTDSTFIGSSISKTVASTTELFVGNKNSASMAITAELFVGAKMSSTNALSVEANKGGKLTLCSEKELKTAAMKLEEVTADNEMKGGTITIDATTALVLEGGTKITLKCGGSEITIEPASITIKSASIKLDASGSLEAKSGGSFKAQGSMVDISGQAMHK